jgi:peptidase E
MSEIQPVYLLAGGRQSLHEETSTLIHNIFKENRITSPNVAYIGAANRDSKTFYQRTAKLLKASGAVMVTHAQLFPTGVNLKKARELLASAQIVYISGGDVFEGILVLQQNHMIDFLHDLYEQGTLFLGISAGSIMLADTWVRWRDPDDNSTAELFPCLGFAPILCDTHDEENGWEELVMALKLSKNGQKGYGIVSGTAIKVYPNRRLEVLIGVTHQLIHSEGRITRLTDILPLTRTRRI